jgi:catechol 2,3-dioxygenase-like lactoylglutathione lyase family enzyme
MASMANAPVSKPPVLVQTVLDTEDARGLAEFYRELFGLAYRPGDEQPPAGEPDPRGQEWLVLRDANGTNQLAFQQIEHSPRATWPEGPRPQMLHLDTLVPTVEDLVVQRQRALDLGARELYDRSEDPDEPLFVLADPAGHPFCIFVGE